jgi:hypothetical protein
MESGMTAEKHTTDSSNSLFTGFFKLRMAYVSHPSIFVNFPPVSHIDNFYQHDIVLNVRYYSVRAYSIAPVTLFIAYQGFAVQARIGATL